MIKITIASAAIVERSGTSKASGKPYSLRIQTAYAHTFNGDGSPTPFPDKFDFLLDADQAPWQPGDYTLHPSAVTVDRDGRLSCAPRLTPVTKPAKV